MDEQNQNPEILQDTEAQQIQSHDPAEDMQIVLERKQLESKKKSNFFSLILMLIFSAINIPALLFANTVFYFSLASTQMVTLNCIERVRIQDGWAYLVDEKNNPVLRDTGSVLMLTGIALAIIAVFLVLLLLSKKKFITLYIAAALFIVDTVLLLFTGNLADSILNLVFHAWIIYSFVVVIIAENKLRRIHYAG